MRPAQAPAETRDGGRLLVIDADAGCVAVRQARSLPDLLRPADLLVVNDAATLPASLAVRGPRGEVFELRLASLVADRTWLAVAMGAGDHRARTEDRPDPPALEVGDRVELLDRDGRTGGTVTVEGRDRDLLRLWRIRFDLGEPAMYHVIYAVGRPVQYAHVPAPLDLWSVQTLYAGAPWALEMPSAGSLVSGDMLGRLRRAGVTVGRLTHAAGLSATGEAALDRRLPLPERSHVPGVLVRQVEQARRRGGRVVAVGTSVVRALEHAALSSGGRLRAGDRIATLRVQPAHRLAVVDGLVSGVHAPGESHYDLLGAFAPSRLLTRATRIAHQERFLMHEFGEHSLFLPGALATRCRAAS